MKSVMIAMLLAACLALAPAAEAGPREEVLATYARFLAAQNAHDIPAAREVLWESPDFLWVSDGRSFWGREAMLARMAGFQQVEVWRARPDLDRARFVEVSDKSAYIHMPLLLQIGSRADGVQDIRFLVSLLFVRSAPDWRIAALFTTLQNPD